MKIQIQITGWGKAPDETLASTSFGSRGRSPHQFLFNKLTKAIQRAVPACFALLLLALPAAVQAQFTYITNADNTITITGYTGSGGNVNIPATINGLPVTSIGDDASFGTALTSVTIPGSVSSIGDGAFSSGYYDPSGPFSIFFTGNAPAVGHHAFFRSPEPLGGAAGEYEQVTIYYLSGTTGWSDTFATRPTVMLNAPPQFGSTDDGWEYTSDGTQIIITGFSNCDSTVTIPTVITNLPVTAIGPYAFENSGLTNVIIPDSVTSIGGYAFYWCEGLTSVTIPDSVTSIGEDAFSFDTADHPGGLYSVTIPNSVTNVGDYAFACLWLDSVTIGNHVIRIGNSAFADDSYLSSVTIPNSVISIGDEAFASTPLATIIIPDSVTSIGGEAFWFCESLTNINVAEGNPIYSSLNGVLFAKSQTILTEFPMGRSGNYTIPNSVVNIEDNAFATCSALTNVIIGNSVTGIGDSAFLGCSSLANVTIGNNVTTIGDEAFAYCANLTKVYFSGNAPNVDSYIFLNGSPPLYSDPTTVYYLPGTLGWSNTFAGRPTALWYLSNPFILNQGPGFGVQSNQFGFTISWATNVSVVVEAATNLSSPIWLPVSTNILVGGTSYFSDPQPANLHGCFYRLRSP